MEEDTDYVITGLQSLRARLAGEVMPAFESRGFDYGNERFAKWKRLACDFLENNLPGEWSRLEAKLSNRLLIMRTTESDANVFWRDHGDKAASFLDSLILDLQQGEYEPTYYLSESSISSDAKMESSPVQKKRVFIVHGHDELAKFKTARFVETLGFEAIILHEQASRGKTIIEKIEAYTDVGFAIVLYTADDLGNDKSSASNGNLRSRARQNVIFEHGYLMAKLSRERVVALVTENIEFPSDISGMVYVTTEDWQNGIAKEMQAAGYEVDLNKLMRR